MNKTTERKVGSRIMGALCMSMLLSMICVAAFVQPAAASDSSQVDAAEKLRKSQLISNDSTLEPIGNNATGSRLLVLDQEEVRDGVARTNMSGVAKVNMSSTLKEKIYDTNDGKFRIHYKNVSEDYVKFVGHAFSKARAFQTSLGFKDIVLTPNAPDAKDGKVAVYIKDLIYDGKASEAVIAFSNQVQRMLVSDNPDKFEKWQIYLSAAHSYFEAVQASYRTNGYVESGEYEWINDGLAKFMVLYTAMNDPEYKQYDEEYKARGYLNKVMVEGKNTYAYQVPIITPDAELSKGITKLGSLSVSYWYYLYKLYGMKVIQDVMTKAGSDNDDSAKIMHSALGNYNSTFTQSVAGWYESLGFWNKGTFGDFSVYEGLMLVNHEMFTDTNSSELPLNVEHQISRYGATFACLKFDT